MAYIIALGILALCGFFLMLANYVERPSNDSGPDSFVGGWRQWHAPWPRENKRLMRKSLRWWEW